jgi:hypothetical protein
MESENNILQKTNYTKDLIRTLEDKEKRIEGVSMNNIDKHALLKSIQDKKKGLNQTITK